MPVSLTTLQPFENLTVNAMDGRGEVPVFRLGSTIGDDGIAIGSAADRGLLLGVKQKSYFKGVRTVFDPNWDIEPCRVLPWVEPIPICLATSKNSETAPLALLDQQSPTRRPRA